jgi:hypothetical protein
MSGIAPAIADVTTPCNGDFTVSLSPPANPAPRGQITINGPGVTCQTVSTNPLVQLCNSTTISVSLNAQTVSTTALKPWHDGSYLAGDLATKINTNSILGPMFAPAAFGNVVHAQARQAAIEYPWQTSCTHTQSSYFPECAFSASLSPIATLGGH